MLFGYFLTQRSWVRRLAAGDIESGFGEREAGKVEAGADRTADEGEIAGAARGLPVVFWNDELWLALGQIGGQEVVDRRAGFLFGDRKDQWRT